MNKKVDDLRSTSKRSVPTYTMFVEGRLLAYIWCHPRGGYMRRSGWKGIKPICRVAFGHIVSFDAAHEKKLAELAQRNKSIIEFLTAAQIEGWQINRGPVTPGSHLRRF